MISKKELEYVNLWANKVPYPGMEYCIIAMKKLENGLNLFETKYANRKYNIIFSDQTEIEFEIKQKNINHMLGIDFKNLSSEYFRDFRKKVLDYDPDLTISSYDMLKLIIAHKDKVVEYDEKNLSRAINYYKISIKCDIFEKLAELERFNYGCINFDKNKFMSLNGIDRFSPKSTKFLYTESDESVSPYFFMGLRNESVHNNSVYEDSDEYIEEEDNLYIVETLIAPEKYQYFFNEQEVVIPTQILTDVNGILNKMLARPEEKIKLLKDYKSIINQYKLPNMINIYGDYLSYLMDSERGKGLVKKI
ncbi:MAG: hypothetical protein ACI31M_01880 [Bacilli bacterium]